jgi:hypothetical protein
MGSAVPLRLYVVSAAESTLTARLCGIWAYMVTDLPGGMTSGHRLSQSSIWYELLYVLRHVYGVPLMREMYVFLSSCGPLPRLRAAGAAVTVATHPTRMVTSLEKLTIAYVVEIREERVM